MKGIHELDVTNCRKIFQISFGMALIPGQRKFSKPLVTKSSDQQIVLLLISPRDTGVIPLLTENYSTVMRGVHLRKRRLGCASSSAEK